MQILQLIALAVAVAVPQDEPLIPETIEVVRDVVYATVASEDGGPPVELALDAAFPKKTDGRPLPVVVYFHGGGWFTGEKSDGIPMAVAMADGGYMGVTVQYRLAGTANYPAAVHDCKTAIRFLRANAGDLGIDPDRIGVWGHSAGGHLAALLGTSAGVEALEGDAGPDGVGTEVACVVSISGPADLNRASDERGRRLIRSWLGPGPPEELTRRKREASPVTHIDPEDPPFLIVHGVRDDIVPIEQARLLHAALEAAGVPSELVPVERAGHFIVDPRVFVQVGEFFDEHLGGRAGETMAGTLRRFARAIEGRLTAIITTAPIDHGEPDVTTQTEAIARGRLESISDDQLELSVPGTDYRIRLVPTVPAAQVTTPVGKRIRGTIEAQGLRMHAAHGGGRFIEPIYGAPRIVAGVVLAVDGPGGRLLVDVSVPMWIAIEPGQSPADFTVGQLVNGYVQSGAKFTPAAG